MLAATGDDLVAKSCLSLCDPKDCSPPGSCPWDSSDKNTGVGSHFHLQVIFLTQGSNPCLLHWQADSLLTEPPEKQKHAFTVFSWSIL